MLHTGANSDTEHQQQTVQWYDTNTIRYDTQYVNLYKPAGDVAREVQRKATADLRSAVQVCLSATVLTLDEVIVVK